jgi:hypothetical protein
MRRLVSAICITVLMLYFIPLYAQENIKDGTKQKSIEDVAVESVLEWLKIIDAGKYKEGWDICSEYLKKAVEKSDFEKSMKGALSPLGKVIKREVLSKKFFKSLPGAPDGEYVVIEFKSVFENKKEAVETITSMKEKDGKLRVGGYYIK